MASPLMPWLRAELQELEGTSPSTLLEAEQEAERGPNPAPFDELLAALEEDEDESPFSWMASPFCLTLVPFAALPLVSVAGSSCSPAVLSLLRWTVSSPTDTRAPFCSALRCSTSFTFSSFPLCCSKALDRSKVALPSRVSVFRVLWLHTLKSTCVRGVTFRSSASSHLGLEELWDLAVRRDSPSAVTST